MYPESPGKPPGDCLFDIQHFEGQLMTNHPGRIFIVTAQGKHSNDERLELYWYNLVDANKPGFTLNGVGQ